MTTEGLLYALSRYDLRGFLIEPASVDPYLQREAIRGGPNAVQSLGPLWQQLMQVLPEWADGIVLEGTPALHCWLWPADRVADGAARLQAISASAFSQRVQACQPQWVEQAAAEGGEAALGGLETLRQLVRPQAELRSFFQAAAARRDAALLYVI